MNARERYYKQRQTDRVKKHLEWYFSHGIRSFLVAMFWVGYFAGGYKHANSIELQRWYDRVWALTKQERPRRS